MKYEPTDQQRAAIETEAGNVCVDAGAGSGKTTVLVDRVLHLLRKDVPLRRIVAITFTRKAAGEMRERLRRAIHDAADPNDPESMTKWRELEYQVESARITTIDAFCAGVLRENALRIGLDPEFVMLAEAESTLLRADVALAALEQLLDSGDGPAHRLAAEYGVYSLNEFLRGLLNAPSAFDRAVAEYAGFDAPRLAERWRADGAAIQRERRAALACDPEIARLIAQLEALDGCCADAADRRESARRDMLNDLHAVREGASDDAVDDALKRLARVGFRGGSKNKWSSDDDFKQVMTIGEQAKKLANDYADPPYDPEVELCAARLTLDLLHVYEAVSRAYADAKAARNALDFPDLLARTLHMIQSRPYLRDRVSRGIRHLLIDEFQDTNHAQLGMARELSRLAGGAGADLFVVGDAQQSIYRFRNAEVEVFADARENLHLGVEVEVFADARELADKTLPLDENFRSVPEIIAFINEFFGKSGLLHAVGPAFHRLTAKRDPIAPGCIEFLFPPEIEGDEDKDLNAYRNLEAKLIASRIAQMCGPGGVQVFDKETKTLRAARFGDVAILLRTRSNAGIYDAALHRADVPAFIVEGAGFYARQEILDMHNLFAAALDPWNEFAIAAFLRGPLACVSDDALMELARGRGLANAVLDGAELNDPAQHRRLRAARDLLRDVWVRREMPLASLVRHVLARTGFEAVLLPQYHGVQKAGNLRKLVDLAENFSHTGRASLAAFTRYLATVARHGLREGDAELFADAHGAVTIMSVHSAKGLEFPIVVLADTAGRPGGPRGPAVCHQHRRHGIAAVVHDDAAETRKPQFAELLKTVERAEEEAEEARVLYVAMTRARDHLLCSVPRKAKKGTWAASIHEQFDLASRSDGDVIDGDGWSARIVRCERPEHAEAAARGSVSFDIDGLMAQANAIATGSQSIPSLTVGSALDRIGGVVGPRMRDSRMEDLDGRALGTAAHAMLERWDFGADPPIDAVLREFCPRLALREAYRNALSEMAAGFRESPLWPRLSASAALAREVPFSWVADGMTLRGKIDLLLDHDLIVDYKTGARDDARHARHVLQLQLYAAAAAAAGRPVREAYVYYLQSGIAEAVDVSAESLAALNERLQHALAPAQAGHS